MILHSLCLPCSLHMLLPSGSFHAKDQTWWGGWKFAGFICCWQALPKLFLLS